MSFLCLCRNVVIVRCNIWYGIVISSFCRRVFCRHSWFNFCIRWPSITLSRLSVKKYLISTKAYPHKRTYRWDRVSDVEVDGLFFSPWSQLVACIIFGAIKILISMVIIQGQMLKYIIYTAVSVRKPTYRSDGLPDLKLRWRLFMPWYELFARIIYCGYATYWPIMIKSKKNNQFLLQHHDYQ